MNCAYFMAGMPVEIFIRLLLKNGISAGPKYLFRLAFIFQSGIWSSIMAFREKQLFEEKIAQASLPKDPLIIVNHWRTGSTLLYQLLDCNPKLAAPTLFQTTFPESFMNARRFIEPIMKRMLMPTRPMDNVGLSMDTPEEDEGALFRMCGISPLERLVFAKNPDYFLLSESRFLPPHSRQHIWDKTMSRFCTKLSVFTGRRLILKNPFHSVRIPALLRLFPEAKFVHIYRDPRAVIPSTVHMWTVVGSQNALSDKWRPPSFNQVISVFDRVMHTLYKDLSTLDSDRVAEIKFENLVRRPIDTMLGMYEQLEITCSDECVYAMRRHCKNISSYKQNEYSVSRAQKRSISSKLGHHFQRGGY